MWEMKRTIYGIIMMLTVSMGAMAQGEVKLSLQQCRERALAHNEELQKDNLEIQRAELDRKNALSARLPQIDGSLMGITTKDQDMMGMTLQMRAFYLAGITLSQPLYTGGKITTGSKLAQVDVDVARLQQQKTRAELLCDVDKAWYSLINVQQKIVMLETYKHQLEVVTGQIRQTVEAEMAIGNDALRVETKLSEIDYQLQKARNGETLCRLALCDIIGEDLNTPIALADTTVRVVAPEALDENIGGRPELGMLRKSVEANKQQEKMARADMLPTVALAGGYSYYGGMKMKGAAQGPDGNYYPFEYKMNSSMPMVALVVKVPIFHWGKEQRNVKKTRLATQQAELTLLRTTRQLGIEVRQAVQNVTDGYRMTETAQKAQQQADENLRVMKSRYDNGITTLTDLLDAESQWQSAHSNLIEAQTQYCISLAEYRRVTAKF